MTISNLRLLEGIAQALQTIDANTADAMSKAMVHVAHIAVDELRKRDNPEILRAHYARGRELVDALVDTLGNAAWREDFAALPADIEITRSWASAREQLDALLALAEKIGLAQRHGATAPEVQALLGALFAWEADGYAFPRPPVPSLAAAAIAQADVEAFIRSQEGDYADASIIAWRPLAGGFSKQTILFDLATARHGKQSFALRGDGATKVLGLRGQEIPREYHLLRYAHAGGVRCAEPMWLNGSGPRPYFISRQSPGRNIGDGIQSNDNVPDSVAISLGETMAKIHLLKIDPSHPDIRASHLAADGPLTRHEAQKRFFEEWVAVWQRNGAKSPIAARAIRWIFDNLPDEDVPATLVHCDCGFNNLLIEDGRISAVLDWEISHLGDPAEDIGWIMFQIKNEDTRKKFLQAYRDAGGIAEVDAFRLKFYEVVASMKMIIAMNDIGECFGRIPNATIHLCAFAVPYLQGPLTAIVKQIEEAERMRES